VGQLHNEFRAGSLQRAITEALGVAGHDVAIERVGETLTPVFDVWSQPEWALGRQEFLCMARLITAAGGAGFRTRIGIRNTSVEDDPWLCVVEEGTNARPSTGTDVRGAITFTDQTDAAPLVIRDGRSRIAPPFVRLRTQNGDALPAGISAGEALIDGGSVLRLEQPVVLRFGQALYFYPGADNIGLSATFYARVRRLLPGERTGTT